MTLPLNSSDYERFKKLAELIYKNRSNTERKPEINIYSSENYVSVEMRGFAPENEIKSVLDGE